MLKFLVVKHRSTTPVSKQQSFATRACIVAAAIMTLTLAPLSTTRPALADEYDQKISALQNQIDQYDAAAGKLRGQRLTYESQLATLSNQKNKIQAQLDLSVAKEKKLENEIKLNEKKLQANKSLLGDTIADLYIDDNISPLEMLASSDNIADYVDKQANRNQVKESVQRTIDEINELKAKLEKQKKEVEQVIADQKGQRDALAKKENEKQRLISQTQGKESAFQRLIKTQNKQIAKLRAEQVAANQRFIGGGSYAAGKGPACGGGYPGRWCNIPMDSAVDDWGMYNRECVSYTAFKVAQSGAHMPYWGGVGNANQWPGNARAAGLRVDGNPRGDVVVAIANIGYYGHAMFVESVNGDGSINISQYNADWQGTYSTNTISPAGLEFIHFR